MSTHNLYKCVKGYFTFLLLVAVAACGLSLVAERGGSFPLAMWGLLRQRCLL